MRWTWRRPPGRTGRRHHSPPPITLPHGAAERRKPGHGLISATLADDLSITSGPDSTLVSLYMRLE